eukprot:GHVT01082856.1.p1 GENE.GHVT01082856.1~~GHVT01082856.1.p1  ORF type:complete len:189 (-),score=15.06 GHVT01082856.1:1533-2099(-)
MRVDFVMWVFILCGYSSLNAIDFYSMDMKPFLVASGIGLPSANVPPSEPPADSALGSLLRGASLSEVNKAAGPFMGAATTVGQHLRVLMAQLNSRWINRTDQTNPPVVFLEMPTSKNPDLPGRKVQTQIVPFIFHRWQLKLATPNAQLPDVTFTSTSVHPKHSSRRAGRVTTLAQPYLNQSDFIVSSK